MVWVKLFFFLNLNITDGMDFSSLNIIGGMDFLSLNITGGMGDGL